jgi:ferredoxin
VTYVIGEPCVGLADRSCLEVCPVHCIYAVGQDPNNPDAPAYMVIDADECIDCGACEPECPVEAIVPDSQLPEGWEPYLELTQQHVGRGSNDGPADERAVTVNEDLADKVLAVTAAIRGEI